LFLSQAKLSLINFLKSASLLKFLKTVHSGISISITLVSHHLAIFAALPRLCALSLLLVTYSHFQKAQSLNFSFENLSNLVFVQWYSFIFSPTRKVSSSFEVGFQRDCVGVGVVCESTLFICCCASFCEENTVSHQPMLHFGVTVQSALRTCFVAVHQTTLFVALSNFLVTTYSSFHCLSIVHFVLPYCSRI
jgi:hypothetical protein